MPIENKFERVADDDPARCQAVTAKNQCPYKAMEHSKFCPMHGGNKAQESKAKLVKRQYDLAQWQGRVENFADHDSVKTLRDEIGITRMLLENLVRQCKNETDLLLYASKIGELVSKIEKLVVSCSRLESSQGMLLDKAAALHLAGQMVEIISRYITDEDSVDAIANEFALAIVNLNGAEMKEK